MTENLVKLAFNSWIVSDTQEPDFRVSCHITSYCKVMMTKLSMQVSNLDSVLKPENPPDARNYCACLKVQHVTLLPKPNPISFELEGILILMAVFFDAI